MVTGMGTILMGDVGECCLVSRKSGQKRTNVLGEKKLVVTVKETGCLVGRPRVLVVGSDGVERNGWHQESGALGRGSTPSGPNCVSALPFGKPRHSHKTVMP